MPTPKYQDIHTYLECLQRVTTNHLTKLYVPIISLRGKLLIPRILFHECAYQQGE